METYEKIKELCNERNESLSSLASAIGVRSSVFTELKMHRTKQLSVATIEKIADYFGVPETYFLEEDADSKQEELFRKRKLLFDLSKKASAEDLDKIIKIVDAFIGE